MTDWQKVRVQFNDADGNEVSAVMWHNQERDIRRVWNKIDSIMRGVAGLGVGELKITWTEREEVKVTPIRELPTGVGAVIVVKHVDCDPTNLMRDLTGTWIDDEGDDWLHDKLNNPDVIESWEVLSEGIQL